MPWQSKFMKGWRSYYGELLWGLLHQHPTRTDAATPLTRIHATFFFFFAFVFAPIRIGLWQTRFRPKRAATMSSASILLLHVALREREREGPLHIFIRSALKFPKAIEFSHRVTVHPKVFDSPMVVLINSSSMCAGRVMG